MNETPYGHNDTSFQTAGGVDGVQKLVEDFYDVMSTQPYAEKIRNMHPDDLTVSIDKLARFLCGWLGGPKRYSEKYGGIAIPPAHKHLPIKAPEMTAWLDCMQEAIDRQDYPSDFRQYLIEQLSVPAGRIVLLREKIEQSPSV